MDELNINPQPEGENPQENQPTPPADQGSFSLDQNQESAPTPEPVQPKGGVLETAEPNQQAMSEQNNPAQMEAPQSAEEQERIYEEESGDEHPSVLEQAQNANDEGKKGGLPKWALIALGVLGLVAVVGAGVYFTNPTLFQGQVREIADDQKPAADEYCQDGYYWPGSQSNDIETSIHSANAQSLLDASSVRDSNLSITTNDGSTLRATNGEDDITAEAVRVQPTLSVTDEVPTAEVNFVTPSLNVPGAGFSPDQCVPINLNDCRTMALLVADPEKYRISPEYAEILKATYDKNCQEGTSITTTERDCGEHASANPTTGECECDDGYFKIGEEQKQVPNAIAAVSYTVPICVDCDELKVRISQLEKERDGTQNADEKSSIQEEINKLMQIGEENGCYPPEERTCEDVEADLNKLNNSPIPPTADQIAALQAESQALGCEDECRENEVKDANGDCMCDEENGYFDIANNSNPYARITRQCVDCEGLANRIKELEDMLANSDMLDMTDAQKETYKQNLQNEIDRLEQIQEERDCIPPDEERTCEDVYAELNALDNNPLPSNDPNEVAQRTALEKEAQELGCLPPEEREDCEDILAQIATLEGTPPAQVTPEINQELAELKQKAEKNQCTPPEEDPCEARIKEIQDLMDQGLYQEAYQKQIEYLESDCRGIEGCRAKLARAVIAKAFLELVANDPVLTSYFQGEYEKNLDDYYLDPECDDRSCDELEARMPTDGTQTTLTLLESGRIDREVTDSTADTVRQQAERSTLQLANDTTERSTLTINQGSRELNLLSQRNLDSRVDGVLERNELLTDEEYYERYCDEPGDERTTLTVVKQVINDDGGTLAASDFSLYIDQTAVTSGVANEVTVGSHVVSEDAMAGYTGTISGDCDLSGNVSLVAGDNKVCTITNNDNSEPDDEPEVPGEIPGQPEIPAAPTDDPVIISETVITPPVTTTTPEQPTTVRPAAPEVSITESPEITKTGPEMYFFFFAFVASQVFYFRKKLYALIENR